MQSKPPTQDDLFSNLPGWHALSGQEQARIIALIQDPSTFSQLLALQRAMFSPNISGQAQAPADTVQPSSFVSQLPQHCQPSQLLFNSQGTSHLARPKASLPTLDRELPSPPRLDRSLLQAPNPFWATQARHNNPAGLLAASTSANYGSRSGFHQASPPLADCPGDLFRSTSLGTNYQNRTLPDELSLRASSMPGSFQDIAARLHLNRAGINTATTSLIPVLSQDWLVIPFGTAQQLLPAHAGDVLSDDGGDAVMLIDENGHNWPMKCLYNRLQERFQLGDGWKAFAQQWGLAHGEQVQLSRRFVSSGCIWLDVQLVRADPAYAASGKRGSMKRKREEVMPQAGRLQSHAAAYISPAPTPHPASAPRRWQHSAVSLQDQSRLNDRAFQAVAPRSPDSCPLISVKRLISCPTYCSRLHVNQHMAEHLLPVLPEAASIKPPLSYVYQSLFKHKISIVDDGGEAWLVQYEGFVSAAQRHYRFTAGWTNLVKQKGIRVGDAVVLERWSDDRFTLHMHIIKNASDSMVAAATTKGKAKRSTARTTQRRTRAESPGISVLTSRQAPKPYSPGSLEALHDAALLCANSPSPDPTTGAAAPLRQDLAPSLDLADSSGGSSVPAAAVLAADAAAVQQQASELGLAAGFTARKGNPQQHSVCHRNGTAIGLTALHRHTSREET
ncbi:hypothetical protein ABBQ32_012710 [Trebouxia sp. C0010 RCD-2024]